MMFVSYLIICLPTKYVSWFNIWASALGTVVLLLTMDLLPVKAAPTINSARDTFTRVYNQTGWPTGGAFCMALLSPTWTLSGYHVAAHVAEETYDAARNVPRAMVWSSWSSGFPGSIYLIRLALRTTDIDSLMGDALGQPIGVLMGQVLGVTGSVVLLSTHFVCQMACGVALVSRLLWHTVGPHILRDIFSYGEGLGKLTHWYHHSSIDPTPPSEHNYWSWERR